MQTGSTLHCVEGNGIQGPLAEVLLYCSSSHGPEIVVSRHTVLSMRLLRIVIVGMIIVQSSWTVVAAAGSVRVYWYLFHNVAGFP